MLKKKSEIVTPSRTFNLNVKRLYVEYFRNGNEQKEQGLYICIQFSEEERDTCCGVAYRLMENIARRRTPVQPNIQMEHRDQ